MLLPKLPSIEQRLKRYSKCYQQAALTPNVRLAGHQNFVQGGAK